MNSNSDASPKNPKANRRRMISPVLIIAFVIIIAALMIVFFPKKQVLSDLNTMQAGDQLTFQYLKNLVDLYPNNKKLKLLLANQDIQFGNADRAIKIISEFFTDNPRSELEWRAQWLSYQILRILVYRDKTSKAARREGIHKMQSIIPVLARGPFSQEQLLALAQDASGVQAIAAAIKIYERLLPKASGKQKIVYLNRSAKLALSIGHYQESADYYFRAQQQSFVLAEKRDYFIAGLKSLQQGNLMAKALTEAKERVGNLQSDTKTLAFLVKLALAANRPKEADTYMKQLLKLKSEAMPKATTSGTAMPERQKVNAAISTDAAPTTQVTPMPEATPTIEGTPADTRSGKKGS